MQRFVLLLVVAGWFVPLFCQASAEPFPADPFLNGQIQVVQGQIQHFRYMAYWLQGLTITVIICGLAVGALQPGATRRRKVIVAVLGFISAVIVAVNHTVFLADYRAYYRVANVAEKTLENFTDQLSLYPEPDKAPILELRRQFIEVKKSIGDLRTATLDDVHQASGGSASQHGFSLLPEAWAQEPGPTASVAPSWAKEVPVDGNLYYLGVADGKTFEEAQANALANARTGASSAFVNGAASTQLAGKPELIQQLAKVLGAAAEPTQTFVAPGAGGGFRGYVLLRLSRSAALFAAQSIFVQAGVPYDQAFLDRIKGDAKAIPAQKKITPRVYLHIASESQRPAAQAIQQALIKVGYLVPGIQNVAGKGYIPDTLQVRYFAPASKAEAEKILGLIKSQGAKDGRTSYVIPTAQDLRISSDINSHFEVWAGRNSL
jgi:hypothetical protein